MSDIFKLPYRQEIKEELLTYYIVCGFSHQ